MVNISLWLLLSFIWSSSYIAIKVGVDTIHPLSLVSGRMIIGAIIMLVILKCLGLQLSKDKQVWGTYAISGLLGNVIPFCLISYGESHVNSGLAAILMGLGPIATVLLAHFLLPEENLTVKATLGVVIGIAGLMLLVGPAALENMGSHIIGQISILGAAICYALTTIYVKRKAKRPPMEMATGSTLVGAVFIALITLLFDQPSDIASASPDSLLAMLYLGLFPTALATLIYFFLVPRLGAIRMSQVNFAVPIGGALLSIILLQESITPSATMALLTIMVAIYLVTSNRKPAE